ncbi:MAG: TetR/AcrR family transcriptional regulator [Clostridiales bacterium]|nr:TetR/AcrR family transcriptional regulator [Clostridiales bacterium]
MDSKEAIINVTIELIEENGEHLEEITVREICKRAGVGLGLLNYHFENKDKLIELCVERIINGIVEKFKDIREKTEGFTPFEKLDYLGNMTLDFLFEHYAVSKISILSDMKNPKPDDNTRRTYNAYLPLVSACRPDWDEATVKRKTLCLTSLMQQVFLRCDTLSTLMDVDLNDKGKRNAWHTQLLHDILEV